MTGEMSMPRTLPWGPHRCGHVGAQEAGAAADVEHLLARIQFQQRHGAGTLGHDVGAEVDLFELPRCRLVVLKLGHSVALRSSRLTLHARREAAPESAG